MPTLHACPLSRLSDTATSLGAGHLVTLVNVGMMVERPATIAPERHLVLNFSDIVAPLEGHVLASADHLDRFLDLVERWDRASPLLIHCWAGISRSTAAAYIAACHLAPRRCENELAQALRHASPSATPNAKLVALADARLGREGRMMDAVAAIGRGAEAFEGSPFEMPWH